MTRLDQPLRRELTVGKERYTLVLDPAGMKLTRKGVEMKWKDIISGDAALTSALEASMATL